jgi:uncharacterized protein DUF6471
MTEMTIWETKAKTILRVEMAKQGLSYKGLQAKLADIGVVEEEPAIRNKVARGKFSAAFLLQCLSAIGVQLLSLH